VTAVIAAAGSGERLGAGGPKAFVALAGRPMIAWSLDAFRACESIHAIVVAVPPGHPGGLEGEDLTFVPGGSSRARSVANALEAVDTELVAIHDAARPLLSAELVEALVARLEADTGAAGVIAASPVTDTIKAAAQPPRPGAGPATPAIKAGGEGSSRAIRSVGEGTSAAFDSSGVSNAALVIERTVDRAGLWGAQTPQVFRTDALRAALAGEPGVASTATDEAMMVEAAGGIVLLQATSAPNLKVTTPFDLRVAELALGERASSDDLSP
jgi:2-C-methyl-D-erythritol 4-phosphate cytidylyltransferase